MDNKAITRMIKKPVITSAGIECHTCYEIFNEFNKIDNNDDVAQYICPLHCNHQCDYYAYYAYCKNGSLHRLNGPARVWIDSLGNIVYKEYWVDGAFKGLLSAEEQIIKEILE